MSKSSEGAGRRGLLAAVSILGVSLGMTAPAQAGDDNAGGWQTSDKHITADQNSLKTNDTQKTQASVKGQSSIKSSTQIKTNSNQLKAPAASGTP
jgi:hypothetical protein